VPISRLFRTLSSRLQSWLSVAEEPHASDLIFVFAGKMERKEYGLELLRQHVAPTALFSVGRFEIRRFSKMDLPVPLDLLQIAQPVPPPQRHYFVFFHDQYVAYELVQLKRFGTLSEVRALAQWLGAHPEIRSLLIVSSAYHLRRIRLCCRALLSAKPALSYVAAPRTSPSTPPPARTASLAETQVQDAPPPSALLLELFKLFVYWFVVKF